MEEIVPAVDKKLLKSELTKSKFIRYTNYENNEIYIFKSHECPNVMKEVGRLREIAYRDAGGSTGKSLDIDTYDTLPNPYNQIIVWNPNEEEIVGGYRYFKLKEANKIDNDRLLLYSENGMGNGIINDLYDIIYVDVESFDNLKTEKMRDEIDQLNAKMVDEGRKYVLIGPGRWGTRDKFIGIPVSWSQISNAKIIVEISLEDFPLDASLGSHFFHNVISMNVGYFSVKHNHLIDFINWEQFKKAELVNKTEHFKHIRFKNPLEVIMDGKKKASLIYFNNLTQKQEDINGE